jgi:hypothetical protein
MSVAHETTHFWQVPVILLHIVLLCIGVSYHFNSSAGNLEQYFALDSWDWNARNVDLFGRAIRLWGPFGTRVLLISDPAALQYLLVDKAYTHQPPPWFAEYA